MKLSKALLATKLKATGVHLLMSLAIFAYLAYQIVYIWYPEPYFSVDGGLQGIRLVAAVDLVLGPVITFLIFDLSKRRSEIIFDLTIIITIQFAALAYGVHTTYTQRPIAIVLIDEFVLSTIEENYAGKLESVSDLKQFSDEHPPIIYSDLPTSMEELDEITRIKLEERVVEHAQLQLYRGREELGRALQRRQIQFVGQLDQYQDREGFDSWLKLNQRAAEEVLIARFSGRYGSVWLVFDPNGKYLSYF
jgi:hypothetical protein